MIDVGVRHHNCRHAQSVLPDQAQDLADIVAGVDDHAFTARFVAENRAVAGQRADRQNLMDHKPIVYLR